MSRSFLIAVTMLAALVAPAAGAEVPAQYRGLWCDGSKGYYRCQEATSEYRQAAQRHNALVRDGLPCWRGILSGSPRLGRAHTREGRPWYGKHESPSSLDAVPKGINPKEQRGAGYCEAAAAVCPLADLQRKAPETETDARMRSRRVSLLRGRAQPLGSVGASDQRLMDFTA
jgi:hypothetical protein